MMEIGGAEGDRTPDLRIANAALCQTELLPHAEFDTTVSSLRFQVRNNPQSTPITQIENRSLPRRASEPKVKRYNESEPTTPSIDIRSHKLLVTLGEIHDPFDDANHVHKR